MMVGHISISYGKGKDSRRKAAVLLYVGMDLYAVDGRNVGGKLLPFTVADLCDNPDVDFHYLGQPVDRAHTSVYGLNPLEDISVLTPQVITYHSDNVVDFIPVITARVEAQKKAQKIGNLEKAVA